MENNTYSARMKEAAQIDETGKSPAWIARYGRDAMIAKTEQWFAKFARQETGLTARQIERRAMLAQADFCAETGRTGEEE